MGSVGYERAASGSSSISSSEKANEKVSHLSPPICIYICILEEICPSQSMSMTITLGSIYRFVSTNLVKDDLCL
jgi:hypothetical protein